MNGEDIVSALRSRYVKYGLVSIAVVIIGLFIIPSPFVEAPPDDSVEVEYTPSEITDKYANRNQSFRQKITKTVNGQTVGYRIFEYDAKTDTATYTRKQGPSAEPVVKTQENWTQSKTPENYGDHIGYQNPPLQMFFRTTTDLYYIQPHNAKHVKVNGEVKPYCSSSLITTKKTNHQLTPNCVDASGAFEMSSGHIRSGQVRYTLIDYPIGHYETPEGEAKPIPVMGHIRPKYTTLADSLFGTRVHASIKITFRKELD